MKIKKSVLEKTLETHCKNKWAREFGSKVGDGFKRNIYVHSTEELIDRCKEEGFVDVYVSVYSFDDDPENGISWDRSTARFDCIFIDLDHDILRSSFRDAQKIVRYLLDHDVVPRVYFSGKKGFHVFIDIPEIKVENPSLVRRRFLSILQSRLKLNAMDLSTIDTPRLSRLPFSIHGKTRNYCIPFDPLKLAKLDFATFASLKNDLSYVPQVVESKEVANLLKRIAFDLSIDDFLRDIKRERDSKRRKKVLRVGKEKKKSRREKLLEKFIKAMEKHGKFTGDPDILKRYVVEGYKEGYAEFKARTSFVIQAFRAGWSEDKIIEVFKMADNYKPKKTKYHVERLKQWWLERRSD